MNLSEALKTICLLVEECSTREKNAPTIPGVDCLRSTREKALAELLKVSQLKEIDAQLVECLCDGMIGVEVLACLHRYLVERTKKGACSQPDAYILADVLARQHAVQALLNSLAEELDVSGKAVSTTLLKADLEVVFATIEENLLGLLCLAQHLGRWQAVRECSDWVMEALGRPHCAALKDGIKAQLAEF